MRGNKKQADRSMPGLNCLTHLGKEQSKTFDALIASYSMVLIRYLLLVYILNKYSFIDVRL